ncbi:MAG: hypothetical protein LBL08_00515 [Candidatus Nomurabacteria bacterium]|jgi:hypothetical protein|nr:hypothetical protein [Candidatus Nomurabacteria bacterium]
MKKYLLLTTAITASLGVAISVGGAVSASSFDLSTCTITASEISTGFDPSETNPAVTPNIWGYVIEDPTELADFATSSCATLTITGGDADVHNAIISTAASLPTDGSVVSGNPLNSIQTLKLDITGDSTITLADAVELHYIGKILNDGVTPTVAVELTVDGALTLDQTAIPGNDQFTTFSSVAKGGLGLSAAAEVINFTGNNPAEYFDGIDVKAGTVVSNGTSTWTVPEDNEFVLDKKNGGGKKDGEEIVEETVVTTPATGTFDAGSNGAQIAVLAGIVAMATLLGSMVISKKLSLRK